MRNRSTEVFLPQSKNNQLKSVWGLADMFDFRNGNTNQKLLTDGRTMHKHKSDSEQVRIADKQTGFCDKCLDIEDACKIRMKDIMPEEFPNEKQLKKLLKAVKEQQMRTDNGCVHQSTNNSKRAMKTSRKASQMLRIGHRKEKMHLASHQCSSADELSLNHLTFTAMLERISRNIHQDGGCNDDVSRSISPRLKQLDGISLQLLQMSAKAFIDQIYINRVYTGRAASFDKSTPFSDASEILRLNRDVFLQLLQDPNSLIVKHMMQFPKGQKDKRKLLCGSKSSESHSSGKYGDPESMMRIQKKNANNHMWKKIKDRYGFSIKRSDCSEANHIVVLEPASKNRKHPENVSCHCSGLQSHQSFDHKGKNIKSRYFSLKEIKRKFKQAVSENRKEQHLVSVDNLISCKRHSLKYAEKSVIRSTSSTRESTLSNDFKRMEKQQKPFRLMSCNEHEIESNKDRTSKKLNSLTKSGSKRDQVDIFEEAKRHLSERLKKVSAGEIIPRKQSIRTLEMILSSPDSPRKVMGTSVAEQKKISSYSEMEKEKQAIRHAVQKPNNEVHPFVDSRFDDQLITSYKKLYLLENTRDETEVHKNIDPTGEDLKYRGHISIPEESKNVLADKSNFLEIPHGRSMADNTCTGQEIETSASSKDDYPENHYQISSADSPSSTAALQILDICKTREGHPSPVSVLEPFSPEDINSPTSTIHEQAGSPLQPRHIDFDDQLHDESGEDTIIDVANCLEGDDYIAAYVRAVMQASELNFEELISGSVSSSPELQHALDSYLFNNLGLFQAGTNTELNLLLDCIHEILISIYYNYFCSSSPYLKFLKPRTRPFIPLEESNVVDQVVKKVNYYILPEMGQPALEHIISKDVAKSGSWIELDPHTEAIVVKMAEDVLHDSLVDTIAELLS